MAHVQARGAQWFTQPELNKKKVLFIRATSLQSCAKGRAGTPTARCGSGPGTGSWTRSTFPNWHKMLDAIKVRHFRGLADVDMVVVPVHLGNHWVRLLLFAL